MSHDIDMAEQRDREALESAWDKIDQKIDQKIAATPGGNPPNDVAVWQFRLPQ